MGEKVDEPKIPQKVFTFHESRFWQKKSSRNQSAQILCEIVYVVWYSAITSFDYVIIIQLWGEFVFGGTWPSQRPRLYDTYIDYTVLSAKLNLCENIQDLI